MKWILPLLFLLAPCIPVTFLLLHQQPTQQPTPTPNPNPTPAPPELDDPIRAAQSIDAWVFHAGDGLEPWERLLLRHPSRPAITRALQILEDPERRAALLTVESPGPPPVAPITRLCEVLHRLRRPPRSAVPALAACAAQCDAVLRPALYELLERLSPLHGLAELDRALADPSEYVRHSALVVARDSHQARTLDPLLLPEYTQRITALFPREDSPLVVTEAAELLLDFGAEAAAERLLALPYAQPEHAAFADLLGVFERNDVRVPRGRLLAFADHLEPRVDEYPHGRALGFVCALLGAHAVPSDRPLLQRCLRAADEDLAAGALRGLRRSHELDARLRELWARVYWHGWDSLPSPQRQLLAVHELDAAAQATELATWWGSPAAEHAQDALEGLERIGAHEHAALLRRALARFPGGRPAPDRATRLDQLAALRSREPEWCADFETAWLLAEPAIGIALLDFELRVR